MGRGVIFGSVCSGIEAASVAWKPLGWKASFFSEIEKFPSAVLDHHYPTVPNLGDMTKFKEWPDAIIDVLVGGTPCQSFSIAGLRKGLDDPRGNLMLTYLAIAARYRPKWLVWENVPGVLSSNGGKDFGTLLGGLGELGYGFAYRVLDAQYAGVPQRRRRVFVVGHLGNWRRAAAVLFERQSLSGDSPPCRKAGERLAGTLKGGSGSRGYPDPSDGNGGGLIAFGGNNTAGAIDVATAVNAHGGPCGRLDFESETFIAHSLRGEGFDASEDGTGRGTPLVPVSFALQHAQIGRKESAGPQGKGWQQDVAFTLDSRPCADAVAFDCKASGQNGFGVGEIASTMRSMGHANSHQNGGGHQAVMTGMQVRRLTPRECERLQGFPDDYTLIPGRVADGPRYKALGNSMAVPVMRWIGERISMVNEIAR